LKSAIENFCKVCLPKVCMIVLKFPLPPFSAACRVWAN
jgi:hypothetical protein